MASLIHPLPLRFHTLPPKFTTISSKTFIYLPLIPLKSPRISLTVRVRSAATPPPLPETQQYILDILDGEDVNSLPCVRTYENDLGRLTIVGDVDLEQALTAAAADGGEAAEEHIANGLDVMVAETVFPGHSDEHSTISTRLFLPSRKVKERAKDLQNYLTKDILSSTTSTNILAMTFRQVTLRQLWSFELVLFRPGTTRDMKDLGNSREVPASFTLNSSNEQAIFMLAEVISISALENTKQDFLDNSLGRSSSYNFLHLFQKPKKFTSKDSSFILHKVPEDEVIQGAKSLLQKFNSMKSSYKPKETPLKFNWWPWSGSSKLNKIGGPEFSAWVSEYIPAYKLEIENDKFRDLKFEGWKESAKNRWEVLLTHSQMVCLANILDMYYEDLFTLPNKKLPYSAAANANLHIKKRSNSLLKMLSTIVISGFFIVAVSAMGRIYLPKFYNGQKYPRGKQMPQSSHSSIHLWSMDSTMLEDVCVSIVKRIQAVYGWNGEEIRKESGGGVSTGQLSDYFRKMIKLDSVNNNDVSTNENDQEILGPGHKIASYQIVLSSEGKIVGFQPISLLAVNNWASHPLTQELYRGKKLSPGFVEPGLKIKPPTHAVLLELVMSEISGSHFVLVRPIDLPEES